MRPTEPPYAFGSGGSWSLTLAKQQNENIVSSNFHISSSGRCRGPVVALLFPKAFQLSLGGPLVSWGTHLSGP